MRIGVFDELFQVFDVAGQGIGLTVTRTIPVIWQEPAQRHVVFFIQINHLPRTELVIILPVSAFAVQRLQNPLAFQILGHVFRIVFLVKLTIRELVGATSAFRDFNPDIAVEGIQMCFIKAVLRHHQWRAGQLVVAFDQALRGIGKNVKGIEAVFVMAKFNRTIISGIEIIRARCESITQHAIAIRGPVERHR